MRQPLVRALAALLVLLAACGEDAKDVNKNIARDLKYARVRVLNLVPDASSVDAIVTSADAPPQSFGDVGAGLVTPFRDVLAGDCTAYLVKGGPALAEAAQTTQEGKRYTLVTAGEITPGAASKPALAWQEEAFEPHESMARVRFVVGVPGAAGASVTFGATPIATDAPLGQLGAFRDVAPGTQPLVVTKDGAAVATFPQVSLRANEVHTLALVNVPHQPPGQLIDIVERADGDGTITPIDPEGAVRETATLRFVHLAPGTPAVDVRVGASAFANALGFKAIAAPAEVDTGAMIAVQAEGVDLITPQKLQLTAGQRYTGALVGPATSRRLVFWKDAPGEISPPTARFANALAGAPPIPMPASQADGTALFPATLSGSASAYQTVPPGPLDVVVQISGGTNTLRIGRFDGVTFPADRAVTAVLAGTFAAPPAVSETSLLLIDDLENKVIADVAHVTGP